MKHLYVFFFLASIGTAIGQSSESVKIKVFQPTDNSAVETARSNRSSTEFNCIKWNYSLMARGVFLLNYEKPISSKLSFEIGAGLTLRDFIFEVYRYKDIKGSYLLGSNSSNTSTQAGYAVEGGIRFYPKEAFDFEGFYISPMLSYRDYSVKTNESSSSQYGGIPSSIKQGYSFFDLFLKLGYQYDSFWIPELITDFYIGFGLRNASVNYVQENSGTSSGGSYVTTFSQGHQDLTYPYPLVGTKIGFSF